MRLRVAAFVAAVALVLTGVTCSSAASACTVLNIPNPLLTNYTAPAGTYCPGPQSTIKGSGITADLTLATINGAGVGYLFKPFTGSSATVKLGTVSNMAGIVLGQVGTNGRAAVTLQGGTLTNVVSGVLYKTNDGGRLDATLTGVHGTGMGTGARTYGSVTIDSSDLAGGGNPSSGDPSGGHALDLNTTGTPIPDQTFTIRSSKIHGFTSAGFQGDGGVAEETVSYALVVDSEFWDMSDADFDTKADKSYALNNYMHGTAGLRMFADHIGRLYSGHNTFAVPAGTAALQATSGYGPSSTHPTDPGLTSLGDSFTLTGTALVAKAEVACQGSTGFTQPRAGVIRLIGATWTPSGGTPWVSPHSVCAVDGIDYFPSVIVG